MRSIPHALDYLGLVMTTAKTYPRVSFPSPHQTALHPFLLSEHTRRTRQPVHNIDVKLVVHSQTGEEHEEQHTEHILAEIQTYST